MKKLLYSTAIIVAVLFVTNVLFTSFDQASTSTSQQVKPIDIQNIENTNALLQYEELEANTDLAVATFSGGCFWCMEGPFESMNGVIEVLSGYSGGTVKNPSYKNVVSGSTGHRESVNIYYDPQIVSFDDLLATYWLQIDPTDAGGQYVDRGSQYTTAIYYRTDEEKNSAEQSIASLNDSGKYDTNIVTPVIPFDTFYVAEDYHQDFYKHSEERYEQYRNGSGREEK